MTVRLDALSVDAHDPARLAQFWAGVLGWAPSADARGGVAIRPTDDTGFDLRFRPSTAEKTEQNQMHLDLTSASLADQQRTVTDALARGARHLDIGQGPEERHVVLADPEGNEFCVIEPDNGFLAECGLVGAVACDGSQAVGYFWSAALGWPLVWDIGQETAVRAPSGGPKLTWGGPPFRPKTARRRLHFDLAPATPGDQPAEVDRLVALGASRIPGDPCGPGSVLLADSDGNEFCVLGPP